MRLDKLLAEITSGSRSEVKQWIRQGRVRIDHEIVKRPETKVDAEKQSIYLDDALLRYCQYEYYMLNKPAGIVSATSDEEHEVVTSLITGSNRKDLFPVGRLDLDTEGLLLITNDGKLSHFLLSPKRHVDKTYHVRIEGVLTKEDVESLEQGMDIGDEKMTLPAVVESYSLVNEGSVSQTEVVLTSREGRYHQVKRMFAALGKPVLTLKRLKMGGLQLDESLAPGEYRELTEEEIQALREVGGGHRV